MRYFLLALHCCFFLQLSAQPVVEIRYAGHARSRLDALRRLTLQDTGVVADLAVIQADVRRLTNFAGIIRADYHLDTLPRGILLTYELTEGATRFPVAQLGGLENNFWWELGYQDQNWRGRGDNVALAVRQIDGRLGGTLRYQQRHVGNRPWGFDLQLERYSSREPLYFGDVQVDYRYDNHNLGASWRYFFQPERDFQLGYTYFIEDYEKVDRDQSPGPDARREHKHLIRSGYHQRRLRYDLHQPAGYDFSLSGEFVFQPGIVTPFYLFRGTWRHYRPLGHGGLLAGRITVGYSANEDTPFAPFVVDSRVNIRGAGNRVDRGTAALVLNLEYRQMLWRGPGPALQSVLFTDIGSWRDPGGEIGEITRRDNFKYFVGGGLRIISPRAQNSVLRIDYGYGLQPIGRRGIVLGLGQYF